MTDDRSKLLLQMHLASANTVLEGLELVVDAGVVAAVYVARAGRILSALRVRGLTSPDEIAALADHLRQQALDDANTARAIDERGNEVEAGASKKTVH